MNAAEIKTLRESLNMNQVQLAQLFGVHPITVSKWERDEAQPTPHQRALLDHFRTGAKDREVRSNVVSILVGVGVGVALALLLRHLLTKK